MSYVLVAALSEDGAQVAPLVAGLRASGLSVWWVGDLAGGGHREQTIASELEAARCVVVVWTKASVEPAGELVQDVAARAKARGILLPVRLDRVTEPLGFGQIQSLDLVQWNGKPRNRRFKEVVAAVKAIGSGKPRPQSPVKPRLLRWLAGVPFLALLSLVAKGKPLMELACRVPGVHTACAHWGLGGVPTPAEEAAWRSRKPGDCSALRMHLAQFPKGAYAQEAERMLVAAEPKIIELWQAEERPLPLHVYTSDRPLPNQEAAQTDALSRSGAEAEFVCAGYKLGGYRLRAAPAKVVKWNCSPSSEGFLCGFDGQAVCQVEVRTRTQREVCW